MCLRRKSLLTRQAPCIRCAFAVKQARMASASVSLLSDESSSWHSAFASPKPALAAKRKKSADRRRRRAVSLSLSLDSSPEVTSPKRKHKKTKKKKVKKSARGERLDTRLAESEASENKALAKCEDPVEKDSCDVLSLLSKPISVATVALPERPSRSKACAKVLVRAGLRCSCHFIHVSHCPNVQFAHEQGSDSSQSCVRQGRTFGELVPRIATLHLLLMLLRHSWPVSGRKAIGACHLRDD